jgi:hypothetical protein
MFSKYVSVVVYKHQSAFHALFSADIRRNVIFSRRDVAGVLRFMRLQYAEKMFMMEKKETSLNVAIWNTEGEMG